jgi:putative copper export protein
MATTLHVAVRLLHVLAVALAVGGAALLWLRATRASGPSEVADLRALAVDYEWLFWGAVGLVVATGVGNLGALAPAVPTTDTAWGLALAGKLLGVVLLLLGSAVRTSMVGALDGLSRAHAGHVRRRLRAGYAGTTVWLGGLVLVGVVLAHG